MRLTVDLPWFTYPRRLAIMVIAMLLLLAAALPASAAPPMTEVTVVNEPDDPVPVTVENEVAVTGGNNAPVNVSGEVTVGNVDPLPVSGDVNATVQGAVDVNGQTYDGAGNLNVNLNAPVTDTFTPMGVIWTPASDVFLTAPSHVTALTINGTPGQLVLISLDRGPEPGGDYEFRIRDEETIAQSFPIPIAGVDSIRVICTDADDGQCRISGTVAGY